MASLTIPTGNYEVGDRVLLAILNTNRNCGIALVTEKHGNLMCLQPDNDMGLNPKLLVVPEPPRKDWVKLETDGSYFNYS
jgi:hypothetical protein